VRSLRRTEEVLRANGVRGLRMDPGRLLVPPSEAMNTIITFSE
jgi:hypothetical protein